MSIKALILTRLLAGAIPFVYATVPAVEQEPESTPSALSEHESTVDKANEEALVASLHFQKGTVVLGNDLATLNLPEQFVFLGGKDAERLLVEGWGNPPDAEQPLGMILPAGILPLSKESWAVTVEYEESGYVPEEGATDLSYGAMLAAFKTQIRRNNK